MCHQVITRKTSGKTTATGFAVSVTGGRPKKGFVVSVSACRPMGTTSDKGFAVSRGRPAGTATAQGFPVSGEPVLLGLMEADP